MARAPLAATDLRRCRSHCARPFAALRRRCGMPACSTDRPAIDDSLMRAGTDPPGGTGLFLILEREDDLARWGFPLPDDTLAALVGEGRAGLARRDRHRQVPRPPVAGRAASGCAPPSPRPTASSGWPSSAADAAEAIDAPAAMDSRRVGCGDLVDDADGAVRRALLYVDQDDRLCYSLAFQLARLAARQRGYSASFTKDEPPALELGQARPAGDRPR
jgi:hypothetical protein